MKKLNQANCPNLDIRLIKPQVSIEVIDMHWLRILKEISKIDYKRSSKG